MKYEIPKTTIFGKPIEGAMERVLKRDAETQKTQPDSNTTPEPFKINNPNIIKHDYIQIPQLNKVISRFELPGYNNLNFENTHFKLHDNGLYMPLIPEFMTHFQNVVESYKSQGKKLLFDSAGNPLNKGEVNDIYLHLTKDHIAVYGNQTGAWTWLDGKFVDDNGLKIHSQHRTQIASNGNKLLKPNKIEPLESCLMKDCYIDFAKLNSQGLPKIESGNEYKQGENIYYWHPVAGRVAGFFASSDWAFLSCDGDPSDTSSSLGVFGVADGGIK